MFFVYAQHIHPSTTHKKCAKVQKIIDIHKKNSYFFAYFKKKQYFCTRFLEKRQNNGTRFAKISDDGDVS